MSTQGKPTADAVYALGDKSTADCTWFAHQNPAKQWEVNVGPHEYSQTLATIGLCTYIDAEPERIARLIAEAGTVLHETGKTPREMADEVARLRAIEDAYRNTLQDLADIGAERDRLAERNCSLEARCAGLEKDAARYRWIRDNCTDGFIRHWSGGWSLNCDEPAAEWDAAIDAALSKTTEGGQS